MGGGLDLGQRPAAAPVVGEVEVVTRERPEVLLAPGFLSRGESIIDDAYALLGERDGAGRKAPSRTWPVPVAILRGDHDQRRRQLRGRELLQPAVVDRLGDDQAVLAVDAGSEQAFLGGDLTFEESELAEHA